MKRLIEFSGQSPSQSVKSLVAQKKQKGADQEFNLTS